MLKIILYVVYTFVYHGEKLYDNIYFQGFNYVQNYLFDLTIRSHRYKKYFFKNENAIF